MQVFIVINIELQNQTFSKKRSKSALNVKGADIIIHITYLSEDPDTIAEAIMEKKMIDDLSASALESSDFRYKLDI